MFLRHVSVILPCIQVIKFFIFGGAKIAVQWYCAPAIGQIEAISANERAKAIVPVIDNSMPHTRDDGPPFIKPGVNPLYDMSKSATTHIKSDLPFVLTSQWIPMTLEV
jgi:hypothetical protein